VWSRLRKAGQGGEKGLRAGGFGLIELLIGLSLFSILIIGVLYGSFQVQRKTYDLESKKIDLRRNLQQIMEEISRELRMAQAVTSSSSSSISFTSVRDGNTRSFNWSGETLTYSNGSSTRFFTGITEFLLTYPASNKIHVQIKGKTQGTDPVSTQTIGTDVTLRNIS
jgi:Tfp pilus assembly protein PilW